MGLLSLLQRIKHSAYLAGRSKNDIHQFSIQGQFAIAQFIEQIFCQVAQGDQFGCVKKPCPPFDRVKTTKNIVEQMTVIRMFFQIHQLAIHIGQHLARLEQKVA